MNTAAITNAEINQMIEKLEVSPRSADSSYLWAINVEWNLGDRDITGIEQFSSEEEAIDFIRHQISNGATFKTTTMFNCRTGKDVTSTRLIINCTAVEK